MFNPEKNSNIKKTLHLNKKQALPETSKKSTVETMGSNTLLKL